MQRLVRMQIVKYFLLDVWFVILVMAIYFLVEKYMDGSITYIGVFVTVVGGVVIFFSYTAVSKLQSRLDAISDNLGFFITIVAVAVVVTSAIFITV